MQILDFPAKLRGKFKLFIWDFEKDFAFMVGSKEISPLPTEYKLAFVEIELPDYPNRINLRPVDISTVPPNVSKVFLGEKRFVDYSRPKSSDGGRPSQAVCLADGIGIQDEVIRAIVLKDRIFVNVDMGEDVNYRRAARIGGQIRRHADQLFAKEEVRR
ncbi:hypothetical protein A2Z23_02075 [Candidatus Curtissbacteria bacterium RBG_16_39_7]|uniref:Uncharacterized protein n=1 Tax=Candidatus Curtissbacteria bacterium RBG_16_39_7 TaxID=1797707 RepID=A0A1F5G1S3_9BACT|nr:MAG: hypothetical protein A2Z23_02075 [Candidatus Curtissbacteria bacterium RBG_16_39_7]